MLEIVGPVFLWRERYLMRKAPLVFISMLLVVSVASLAGCAAQSNGSGIAGVYVNQRAPSDYIELESNHAYTLFKDGKKTKGSYEIDGINSKFANLALSSGSKTENWGFFGVRSRPDTFTLTSPNKEKWSRR